jgi:hypothetical protein
MLVILQRKILQMKNYLLLLLTLFSYSYCSQAQEEDYTTAAGVVAALPIGERGSRADYGFGAEFMYLKRIKDKFQVGGSLGYTQYSADDDLNFEDMRFLPIAAKGAYAIGDLGFGLGLDLGYAIGLNENNNGGFLYEPKATLETSLLYFSIGYRGILINTSNLHAIQLGVAFKLN